MKLSNFLLLIFAFLAVLSVCTVPVLADEDAVDPVPVDAEVDASGNTAVADEDEDDEDDDYDDEDDADAAEAPAAPVVPEIDVVSWKNTEYTTRMWQLISAGDKAGIEGMLEISEKFALVRSEDGRGPIFWAYEFEQDEIVDLLIKNGADPTWEDTEGTKAKDI